MAEYQAYTNWQYNFSDKDRPFFPEYGAGWIDSAKPRAGNYSLVIPSGCFQLIWYGCNAGQKTISVWMWKPSGASAAIEIQDPDSGEMLARAEGSQSEQWEKLEVTFMAEKRVYQVKLRNTSTWWGVGKIYFDDLE
jgi:hypothetical protein